MEPSRKKVRKRLLERLRENDGRNEDLHQPLIEEVESSVFERPVRADNQFASSSPAQKISLGISKQLAIATKPKTHQATVNVSTVLQRRGTADVSDLKVNQQTELNTSTSNPLTLLSDLNSVVDADLDARSFQADANNSIKQTPHRSNETPLSTVRSAPFPGPSFLPGKCFQAHSKSSAHLFSNYLEALVTGRSKGFEAESFLLNSSEQSLPSVTVNVEDYTPTFEPPHPLASEPMQSQQDPSLLPLFEGSPLSVNDCMVSMLTYAQSCHLSGSNTSKLLKFLELVLPQPNNLPQSSHLFHKYFADDTNELLFYFYCSNCMRPRESSIDICNECSAPKRRVGYFIVSPLDSQIRKLYKRKGFAAKLQYKHNRVKKLAENIEDLYDGLIYKEVEESKELSDDTMSFTIYWDGVSIFECSEYSMTPCMLSINELPPDERHRQENILIGGLWGGDSKPHPNIFLLPIYHELEKLKAGINVRLPDSDMDITVKGILLYGECDTPAKSSFMCMKGHSGYFSCPKCFIKGEKSEKTGKVMVFPHQDELELRNDENFLECARLGVKSKDGCRGVYGPSVLSYMFPHAFIRGVNIDVMHCAYMGILKQHLKLWFDPLYKNDPFSLFEKIGLVNNRLRALQLPHFVQRLPIDVDKCLSYWKASLCRNFLLFFVLVILKDLLPQEYLDNLSCLVDGLALLNSDSISRSDLSKADKLLINYSKEFERLYGKRHMSMNIHLLLHLTQAVQDCGNLYLTSCFRFEDLNGKLAGIVHGTRHAILQISRHLNSLTQLPLLVQTVKSENAQHYCNAVLQHKKNITITQKVAENVFVVGSITDTSPYLSDIKEFLSVMFKEPFHIRFFDRLYKHGQLFVSCCYKRGSRLSSYCKYEIGGKSYHGKILTFALVHNRCFVFLQRSIDVNTEFYRYVLYHPSIDQDLVPVSSILCVTFCLKVDDMQYLVDPLNSLEIE